MKKVKRKLMLSIVGRKKSGKTTFLKELISEFVKRGYKVGTIKHDVHGFEIDKPGKDSWIHQRAGAASVAISSGEKFALIKKIEEEMPLGEIISRYFNDVDIVLTEGYKRENLPKIEVMREEISLKPLIELSSLLLVVSDKPVELSVPCFSFDEVSKVADFLEEKMQALSEPTLHEKVEVWVDGKKIPLNRFVKSVIGNTVKGMLSSLKGGKGKKISLHIYDSGGDE